MRRSGSPAAPRPRWSCSPRRSDPALAPPQIARHGASSQIARTPVGGHAPANRIMGMPRRHVPLHVSPAPSSSRRSRLLGLLLALALALTGVVLGAAPAQAASRGAGFG